MRYGNGKLLLEKENMLYARCHVFVLAISWRFPPTIVLVVSWGYIYLWAVYPEGLSTESFLIHTAFVILPQ